MRLLVRFSLFLLCLNALSQSDQQVVGSDIGLSFKGTYLSRYIFRGRTLNLEDTYQGEFGLGIASWSYNLLYSDPTESADTFLETEYNHNLGFTTVSGRSVTTLGYQLFDYQGNESDTQELFIRYSRATQWNPSYGIAYDIDRYKGYYLDFSMSRSLPFTRRSQFAFSGQFGVAIDLKEETDRSGFVTEEGIYSKDGLVHASLHINYLFQFHRRFSMEVGYAYYRANDDLLYNETTIDRDQPVAHASFKLVIP